MGFFNSLWSGIKKAAGVVGSVLSGVGTVVAGALGGAEIGGPIGGLVGGVSTLIGTIEPTIKRVQHYINDDEAGSAGDLQATYQQLHGVMSHKVLQNAMSSVTAKSPQVVKDIANIGASFHDSLAKTGDIVSAVKAAGGNPLSGHIADSMSNAIINEASRRGLGNQQIVQSLHDPVSRFIGGVSKSNSYHQRVKDIRTGRAEAAAVRSMAYDNPPEIME